MGIAWISIPAHDQANRFNAVPSLGTLGTVFRACRRLPETATLRFYIRTMPTAPNDGDSSGPSAYSLRPSWIQRRPARAGIAGRSIPDPVGSAARSALGREEDWRDRVFRCRTSGHSAQTKVGWLSGVLSELESHRCQPRSAQRENSARQIDGVAERLTARNASGF